MAGWWFPQYYDVALGNPSGAYTHSSGVYRRLYHSGLVVIADSQPATVSFDTPHTDTTTGTEGTQFQIPAGDARIFVKTR